MPSTKAFDLIRASSPTISVGIISANLMNIEADLIQLEKTDLKMIHYDVMDGCFVPYMTVGPPLVKGIKTDLLKDVHLMIQDPLDKVEDYVNAGADMITVHIEACRDIKDVLVNLGKLENKNDPNRGIIRGIAINPDIPVESLEPLINNVDMIVVLAVNPKIKGLPFDESFVERFDSIRKLVANSEKDILLCIDGGIKLENVGDFAKLGADILVSGSAIFKSNSPAENVDYMLRSIKSQIL
ncbi:ribulose-phosphate 3-epimerase [Bacteroidota bacterium]